MDLNNIGEAEDRISGLPDSLVHYILSFLETKSVAQTCVLSKTWNRIWTSIPTLKLQFWDRSKPRPSLPERDKFMDFVDRTLHLHDTSSVIQNFDLSLNTNVNAARVHSWITSLTNRNVKILRLSLFQDEPFRIPSSLFTCESLVKLYLHITPRIYGPKNISFPNIKSLTLNRVQFTDDCWDDQFVVNCPVLEELILEDCTWFGIKKICILTPSLKDLQFVRYYSSEQDGLRDCNTIQIHAPSLASLIYWGSVAKDYDLSSFLELGKAAVEFFEFKSFKQQSISHGTALSKFLQALSHVRCLSVYLQPGQDEAFSYDFVNCVPTFHNMNKLKLHGDATTDKLICILLKAAPNLKRLVFQESSSLLSTDERSKTDEPEDLFLHLQSVQFWEFSGEARELRWVELILKNAKSLQIMTIEYSEEEMPSKVVVSELLNLPRASSRCVVKFI